MLSYMRSVYAFGNLQFDRVKVQSHDHSWAVVLLPSGRQKGTIFEEGGRARFPKNGRRAKLLEKGHEA